MKTLAIRITVLAVLVFTIYVFPRFAFAQSNSKNASLSGTLLDPSGRGIGEVHITAQLEGITNGQIWTVTSSSDGSYSLAVPPGRYRIRFEDSSFVSHDSTLELSAGESRKLDVHLHLEPFSSSVVVTAEPEPVLVQQTTASVTEIAAEEINQRQSVPLADLLLFQTGIAIGQTGREGGQASIFLNGGNSYDAKVLIDGTSVNIPGGNVDFSNFTLDNIDKVEIVRGAESAFYGTDAVSGVIQLFTHRGETRIPAFSVFSEGGSFSSGRGGGQISGLLGAFDYSAAASYFQTEGQGSNDFFVNRTLSGNFGYAFSKTNQLRLSLRNNTSDAGLPGQTLLEPPSLHQFTNLQDFGVNVRWEFTTGEHWHHQITGAESYTHNLTANLLQSFYATDPFAFCPQTNPKAVATPESCDYTYSDKYEYNRASGNAQTSYASAKFYATAGYQYEVENAGLPSLSLGHVRRNNQAGYLDFRYLPHPRLVLDLGGRADDNGFYGTRFVPRAGAALALHYGKGFLGDTRYRVFYGEGIVEPRFDQLYDDIYGDIGNPLLKPEESKTWNTGIEQKLANDRVKLSADYFSNQFYNIISFEFCSPNFPPATGNDCNVTIPNAPSSFGYYFNTDRARTRGMNAALETRLVRWLTASANYTYDDSRVLISPNSTDPSEIPGNRLFRRPLNSGSVTVNGSWRRFNINVAGYFTGTRTDSDFLGLGFTRNPGYARFDVATSYDWGHGLSTYGHVTNLFDKQYQDAIGYPALGRDFRIGMKYQFSGRN